MEKEKELKVLNPQIEEVTIGVRELRKIKIYPLSMGDQLKLTSIIVDTLQKLFNEKEQSNFVFAETVRILISDNLGKIMTFVTDEGEELLNDITNIQAVDIAELIFEMNYSVLEKKTKMLIEKVKKVFQLQKQPQTSSEDTPNTDLTISTEEVTEKEE